MTYVPSAYAARYAGSFHIFLTTPSNVVVRLTTTYTNITAAEVAITTLGFRLIPAPFTPRKDSGKPVITFANLNRGNTNPR